MNQQGMAGQPEVPQRQLDVPAAIELLGQQVSELEAVWGNLDNRLQYVLQKTPSSTNTDKRLETDGACEVSQIIRAHSGRIHTLRSRIEEVLDNLEI